MRNIVAYCDCSSRPFARIHIWGVLWFATFRTRICVVVQTPCMEVYLVCVKSVLIAVASSSESSIRICVLERRNGIFVCEVNNVMVK